METKKSEAGGPCEPQTINILHRFRKQLKEPNAIRHLEYFRHTQLKISMRIIFNRIKGKCEEYLSRSQYGFRQGSGTRREIFGLTTLAERSKRICRSALWSGVEK